MPRTPCPHKNRRLRTLVATTLFAALALASLAGLDTAHAQRGAKNANTSKKTASTKRVFVGRGSDSGAGSRQTIKSDNPLNDYSAYRSGDRFNVVIPNADANAMGKGGAGRGYTDMQVQQRGNDVVLSYKLQPGAKPRVEQKFNRLDVVFETPEGGAQPAATRPAQKPATPATNDARAADARQSQTANRTAQAPAPSSTNGAPSSRTPTAVTQPATPPQPATQQQQTANAPSTSEPQPGTTATTTNAPAAAPQSATAAPPEQLQLAQARAPETPAPSTRTSAPATTAVPGPSFGATLLRNWPLALIGALLVVGLGLFLATRRSSATSRTPPAHEAARPAPVAEAKPAAIEEAKPAAMAEAKPPAVEPAKPLAPVVKAKEESKAKVKEESKAKPDRQQAGKKKHKKANKAKLKEAPPAPAVVQEETPAVVSEEMPGTTPVIEPLAFAPLVTASALAGAAETEEAVDDTTKAEPPTVEPEPRAVEETVVEEEAAAVQEAAAEEVVVEETLVEEIVAEETAAEEAFVEEAVVEEAAAEDVVVEEAEVEEAAVETTVGEAAVEGTVVEEAAAVEPSLVKPLTEARFAEEAEAAGAVADLAVEDVAEDVAVEPAEVGAAPAGEVVTAVEAVTSAEAVASPGAEIDSTVAADTESVQAETKRLLDGERYDRGVLRSADMMGRQMIAAELLSALAGRNAERRSRARAAFIEHGFFNEAAHDLHYAEAPAERAAAARSLALAGDRAATSHLVAALEDDANDVRRAAVEALAELRDPAAVGPLEDLRERQKKQREKLPRRTLQNAIEVCKEGAATAPPFDAPAAETASVGQAPDVNVESAPAEETFVAAEEQRVEEGFAAEANAVEEERAVEQSGAASSAETEVVTSPEGDEGVRVESKEVEPVIEDAAAWFSLVSAGGVAAVEETRGEEAPVTESPVEEETVVEWSGEAAQFTESPFVEAATFVDESAAQPARVEEAGATFSESYDLPTEVEAKALEPASALGGGTEDWIELDVEESSFAPAAPSEAGAAPTGLEDAAAYDAAPVEIEPHAEKQPLGGTAWGAPQAGAAGRGAAPPPRVAEEKGIEQFDELSTVPKAIQQRITSADTSDRAAALADLSRLDPDEAFHHICAAFDDDAREVRNAAARALFDLNPDRADSFTRALREATAERRRHIGAAINNSGLAAESIGQLTGESRDKTYEAFSLLFLMAKAGEVQPLLRAIESHPNSEVRLAVVKLLALSGQKDILPAFRRLAVRGSLPTEVRSAVMEAIYQISSSQDAHSAA